MAADLAKVSLWLEAMTPAGRCRSSTTTSRSATPCSAPPRPCSTPASPTPPTPPSPATTSPLHRLAEAQREAAGRPDRPVRRRRPRRRQHRATAPATRSPTAPPTASTLADVAWAAQRYATLRANDRHRRAPAASPTPGAPPSSAPRPPRRRPSPAHDARHQSPPAPLRPTVVAAVDAVAARHRLFHWHLEFPEIFRVPDDGRRTPPPAGRAASRRRSATRRGSGSSCRSRSSSPPATRRSPRRTTPPPARRPSPPSPTPTRAARRVPRGQAPLGGREPVHAHQRPLPALRRWRRQHLQRVRRALPHSLAPAGRSGIITPTGLATDATTAAFFADTLTTQAACRVLRLRERGEDLRERSPRVPLRRLLDDRRRADRRSTARLSQPSRPRRNT